MKNQVQLVVNTDLRSAGTTGTILEDMGDQVTVQFYSHDGFSLEEENIPKFFLESVQSEAPSLTTLLTSRDVEVEDTQRRISVSVEEPQSTGLVTIGSSAPAPRMRKRAQA